MDVAAEESTGSEDDGGYWTVRDTVHAVGRAGIDCPVLAVGSDIDAAAVYEAGADEVIPLGVADHAETIADRVAATVADDRHGRFLADLIDETGDGIIVHDPESGEILGCNRRFYTMLGYDPESDRLSIDDIAGHDPAFSTERAVSLVRRAAAGESVTFEWRDPTNDDSELLVEVTLNAAELGGTEYVVASVRDITARDEHERQHRRNRGLVEAFTAAFPDYAFVYDREGRYLDVLTGQHGDDRLYSDADLIGRRAHDMLSDDTADRIVSTIRAALDSGDSQTVEYELDYPDRTRWFEGRVTPLPEPYEGRSAVLMVTRDVTGRVERERELASTRDRLEQTFERVADAFFAVDDDWTITYANERGEAVIREAGSLADVPDELRGQDLWELIPDAVGTAFYDEYHRAMREQEPVTFEEYYEPLDIWFEVRAYPDEDGLSVYFSDITERKRRERELELYETILESLDDAVYAIEPDGTIQYVNEKYAAMKGVERSELIGTDIYEWVDEETNRRAGELRDAIENGEQEVGRLEYEFRSVDGETTPAEMRFAPIDDATEVAGRVGVIRDITERKERERELYIKQRALEEASMPLTLTDPSQEDNPLVFVNEAFEELTGYETADAVGRNCRFLQGPDTDPETVAEMRAKIDAEETFTTELRNYRDDGSQFWNRLEVTPIYDEDGSLLRFLGSQADVTERRRNSRARRRLLSTSRELIDVDSRTDIAQVVSDAAAEILRHDLTAVYLRSDDAKTLEPVAWSESVTQRLGGPPDPSGDGPVGEAFRSGEPVSYDDIAGLADSSVGWVAPVRSVLALPLGEHGVLAIGATEPDAFGQSEIDRAQLLTVTATSAFDRADRTSRLEQYKTLFETVQDKLYVIDGDGYIEMVSDPLAESVGYDADALAGQHISTIIDEETVAKGENLILDLLVTPDSVSSTYEGTLVARDGTETPIEIELSLLPYDDHFRGSVGAVRDISERKQRERELRVFQQAITEAGVGLAMYGPDGRFEYVNDHYASILGTDREAVESTPVWDIFRDMTAETFDSYWSSFVEGETRTSESDNLRADASTVPVETVTTAVDIDGSRHHIVTVMEITGRREHRQQTEVLHRVIRHNLRNDLTVVLGHAEYLAERLDDDADGAETIVEMAERLMELTDTARDAEQIIERDTVRRPTEVVAMLRSEVSALRADYDVVVETDLPETRHVLADSPLEAAFHHVLLNAVEHNPASRPQVWVRLFDTPGRSGWTTIEIADNGPGIPDHERAVLTAGEETPLRHGSGLGLWIVHWVVTRFGGDLDFEGRDGGGSIVRISLPTARSPTDDRQLDEESTDIEPD